MGLLEKIFRKTPKRNKEDGSSLERYRKSFIHAIEGIIYCIKFEHNTIIIIISAIIVTLCGFFFGINKYEWLFVITMIGVISACEMINSSIEAAIDLTTSEIHPLAKISKDTASSATLILSITALIGGLIIFLPKVIEFIGGLL